MDILKLLISIPVILGAYKLFFQWPTQINRAFNDRHGQQGWSLAISIILAVLLISIIIVWGNLLKTLFCIAGFTVTVFFAYARIIVKCELVNAAKEEQTSLILAQFLSVAGIVFILLFVLEIISIKRKKK